MSNMDFYYSIINSVFALSSVFGPLIGVEYSMVMLFIKLGSNDTLSLGIIDRLCFLEMEFLYQVIDKMDTKMNT